MSEQKKYKFLEFMDLFINGIHHLDGAYTGQFGGLFVSSCMELNGNLDMKKLQNAIQTVYDKIESSRIVIVKDESKQYFKILEKYEYKLDLIKFEAKSYKKIKKLALDNINKFNKEGPLVHDEISMFVRVYQLKNNNYIIALFIDHCVADGYAASMIMRMLMAAYKDPNTKCMDNLVSFEEYYEDELKKFENTKNAEYWRKEVANYKPILFREDNLPNKSHLPDLDYYMVFPSDMISEIAKRNKVTSFNIISLATHLALYATYGIKDSAISIASGNRMSEKELRKVAMITNLLTNRIKIEEDKKVSELLQYEKRKTMENIMHRDSTFKDTGVTRVILTYMSLDSTLNLDNDNKMPSFDYATFSPKPTISGIDFSFLILVGLELKGTTLMAMQCCKDYFLNEDILSFKKAFEDFIFFINKKPDATVREYYEYTRSGKHLRGIKYFLFKKLVQSKI
ncbi:condensation domain-containing protein [Clostridium paraputrificum]|uniref:condensation domain-containing protein n=1 Tax=Clostridium paraputrificum TaxID=29363 RepID=UPI003D35163D